MDPHKRSVSLRLPTKFFQVWGPWGICNFSRTMSQAAPCPKLRTPKAHPLMSVHGMCLEVKSNFGVHLVFENRFAGIFRCRQGFVDFGSVRSILNKWSCACVHFKESRLFFSYMLQFGRAGRCSQALQNSGFFTAESWFRLQTSLWRQILRQNLDGWILIIHGCFFFTRYSQVPNLFATLPFLHGRMVVKPTNFRQT